MSDLDLFLVGLIVKWTILLSIFWLAYWLLPRTSLTPRVWLWRVAVVVTLGVTIMSALQPFVHWPALATIQTPPMKTVYPQSDSTDATNSSAPQSTAATIEQPQHGNLLANVPLDITPIDKNTLASDQPAQGWSWMMATSWMIISSLLLARLLVIVLRDQRRLRERQPVVGVVREQFERLLTEFGGPRRRVIELAWSSKIDSPVATGLWRPAILLPETLRVGDEMTLRSALAHELAHIVSQDIGWSLVIRVWQAMAWVCPLAWWVPRQHHEACELLADHRASRSLANGADYRRILANLALNLLAPSASPTPHVAAMSMFRTPVILHRLRMLELGGAHARVTLMMRCVFGLICVVGLLVGGIGIARTRAQEALSKSFLIETQPVMLGDDAHEKALSDSIRVLAPDGSPAKGVRVVFAADSYVGNVVLSEDTKIFPMIGGIVSFYPGLASFRDILKPEELAGEAVIQRSRVKQAQFVVLWNEQGYRQFVSPQLVGLKEAKLQPWSGLDLRVLHGDQPLGTCEIEVSCASAGDGVHQGVLAIVVGTTDDKGRLVLERVPPGVLSISRKTYQKKSGDYDSVVSPRKTTVLVQPGEVVEVTQGGGGQTVEGNLKLAGYSPAAFQAQLVLNDWREAFDFDLDQDGHFVIEDVPAGKGELRFRNVKTFQLFAEHKFECPGIGGDPAFSVGTIEATPKPADKTVEPPASQRIQRGWLPTKIPIVPANEPVRKIDYRGDRLKGHYVLLSAEGQVLYDLTDVEMPGAWGSCSAYFDLDIHNHRLALLVRDADGKQYLSVMSDQGTPLWTRHLMPLESHRIAFDTKTGNLWLLVKNTLDDGTVKVFSPDGNQLQSYNINAFTLTYCESDHSFWFGGRRDIKKVSASDGRVLASYALPKGTFSIDQLLSRSDGGVLAGESAHPNMPGSANRLWHVDSQGKLVSAVDLGNLYLQTQPPQPLGDDYIAPARRIVGWLGAYEHEDMLIRISGDLTSVHKITKLDEEIVHTNTPGQVWLTSDKKRWLVKWDKKGKVFSRDVSR